MATSFFNPGVTIDLESNVARTILRVYFIGGFAIINFVASKALRATARMQFIRRDEVNLAHLTGWLSGLDIFTTAWTMRRPPGGRAAAILMIIVLAIGKATDLTIAGLVNPGPHRQSLCPFGEGLVVGTTGPYIDNRPPQTWQPFTLAWNAQQTSINNGGQKGIYRKTDGSTAFAATANPSIYSDILTTWNCDTPFPDQTFPDRSRAFDVVDNLTRSGFLYGNQLSREKNTTFAATQLLGKDPGFENFVVWTSSVPDGAASSFSVKAAVQVIPRPRLDGSTPVSMRPLNCSLESPAAVEAIASSMIAVSTLWDWVLQFQGTMYPGTGGVIVDNAADLLSRYLNSMFMVQGANNSLSSNVLPGDSLRIEGCVKDTTKVPFFIVILVPFVFLTIVAMGLWWLITEMRIGLHRGKAKCLPYDATDWMLQAMREHDMKSHADEVLKYNPRDISRWKFVKGHGHQPSHLVHGDEEDDTLQVTATPKHEQRYRLTDRLSPRALIDKLNSKRG